MHKKLEAELVSLAHSILQMKNKDEVLALKEKARLVYEKLSVLSFVDDYIVTTPNLKKTKEELVEEVKIKIENKSSIKPVVHKIETPIKTIEKPVTPKREVEEKSMFEPTFDKVKIDIRKLKANQISIKEEFRDSISADKTSTLFDDDDRPAEKKTLNDKMFNQTIQIGLNDRIAFVKNLFNFSQADFNRVLSQLNTLKSEKEAKDFIYNQIKPDYNWAGKEEYEARLINIIERKFS
ncbi:hypothetical protein JBL43_08370 [Aureibaculum sp. A20]|uniref:DUF4476 domain-containing protein n=1 Tax=Aureibaculum flavum TaxID=2795986 RepID=A0ABS0WQJ8_9FLAO|nr:hypothetical protein [Aureibaculum flavum]MBJ2174249.1 hypothetical protein [Aureibaculum flavum]